MSILTGKRILIVDDESLIALHAEDLLIEMGAVPIGPAGSVEEALSHIAQGGCDAVLLDANLHGRSSEEVARRLERDRIPFVVVTGYGKIPWQQTSTPVLAKPYNGSEIGAALMDVLKSKTAG